MYNVDKDYTESMKVIPMKVNDNNLAPTFS